MVKKILRKYIGQCLVNFLDHINMPNFHLSSVDGKTTPKKILKFVYPEKKKNLNKMILYFFLILLY